MRFLFAIFGFALLALVTLARLFILARWRAGWAMYLANVVWETFPKKVGIRRFPLEAMAAGLGLALLGMGGLPWAGVVSVGATLLGLEILNRRWERRLIDGDIPADLVLTLEAPFTERLPRYRLGVLWVGRPFEIELIVSNPSEMATPSAVNVNLGGPVPWLQGSPAEKTFGHLPPGGIGRAQWALRPDACQGAGILEINVECGGAIRRIRIEHDECRSAKETQIARASISRYPGGRRCALAWRGDMDLYDTLTLQSIEGLEVTLGLAARYAFPQTMCLSTRLSLDEAAARDWAAYDGQDHGAAQIPRFIEWMRAKVELRHAGAYPAQGAGKPYVMELGNHGHLHYDTATSSAPENGWKSHARMGAGRYPWMGADASSFGEQRDNILEAARWCERMLGFVPRCWAKPGRCNDADTARAAEAAGCEVLSGSDIRARDNVLFQPPPHHPGGTSAVELTTRHPCDPQHIHHFGMLLFWLHRTKRLGMPMVFMCHQHMRQFEGQACARFTEHFLRRALMDFHGEFYVDTLFGVGKYWREVLSAKTLRVAVSLEGARIVVENRSDMDFERVPVDLELADGGHSTRLVSVRSGEKIVLDLPES
ncbi:MAG: hypothetical protein EOM72_00230 [Opitutae bacterium]|nr:hypothetical protein [Opitutae bacterium]